MRTLTKSFETLKKSLHHHTGVDSLGSRHANVLETDASDYTLTAILSTISPNNSEIHLIAFHSQTFTAPELSYDVHNKKLLVIFEAFKIWRHHLKGLAFPIDVITNHKNLEYFMTMKLLTRRQVYWSEYLSQFNLIICFFLG